MDEKPKNERGWQLSQTRLSHVRSSVKSNSTRFPGFRLLTSVPFHSLTLQENERKDDTHQKTKSSAYKMNIEKAIKHIKQ